MIETILFLGGIFTAWTLLGLVCAERHRRLRQIQEKLEAERAAEAARAAEPADLLRRRTKPPANAASSPEPDVVVIEPPQTAASDADRAAA